MENSEKSLPRNVILDLLPAYIAGEVSKESKTIVEEYAKHDPEIARLISKGELAPEVLASKVSAPADLEMKTMKRIRYRIRRQLFYVALVTASLLLVPMVAMLFTDEVNWTWTDFLLAGVLLFSAGLAYVLISRMSDRIAYRAAVGVAVLTGLLVIWTNLAVGIIGSENNPANLLFLGVLAVGIIGAGISRLRPEGMAYTMFSTAIAQFLVPFIAMIIWRSLLKEPSGITVVIILNSFFALMFAVSGVLFRNAKKN